MKQLFKIMLVVIVMVNFSCKNDDDNKQVSNKFAGEWNGTYSGDSEGTWTATFGSDGIVSGTADGRQISGTISNEGDFTATVGEVQGGSTFTGQFSGNQGSGTWENITFEETGTWQGTRN